MGRDQKASKHWIRTHRLEHCSHDDQLWYAGLLAIVIVVFMKLPFNIRYRVHDIGNPYMTYTIKVTLQQLDFQNKTSSENNTSENVWRTIGTAYVGPQMEAQNIPEAIRGNASSPQVS